MFVQTFFVLFFSQTLDSRRLAAAFARGARAASARSSATGGERSRRRKSGAKRLVWRRRLARQ